MSRFGQGLIQSLTETVDYAQDKADSARVPVVEAPDVRAVRRHLRMSQLQFSAAYRIPLATLKNWEQGRRQPDAPATAYLQAIAKRPSEIRDALTPAS